MYGFTLNNKHSYNDFSLRIINREFNPPKKRKIKLNVPFMNGTYDFSSLYGEVAYEERVLKYTLDFKYSNKIEFLYKKNQITNWIMNSTKEKLYDDLIPGYYFLAECEDEIQFNEYEVGCEISIKFIAYPFMIRELREGNDIWDKFNFELDLSQETLFNINGSLDINLYNDSIINKTPEITCSSNFEITKNGVIYNFKQGTYKDWRFILNKGNNKITIKGNGNIEFKFFKEVL